MENNVFNSLVGQDSAISALMRAAHAARVSTDHAVSQSAKLGSSAELDSATSADNSEPPSTAAMSHAWLITGPPGSGRSLAARAFAAALECTHPTQPGCGECSACKAVMAGNHPDVEIKATNTVTISAQEVRNMVAQAYLAPATGKWRIFIIEDADRMLSRTTNVLLKAIEEPADCTVWILCTTAPADVLPTIRSRCRNVNLVTPSVEAVANLLQLRDGATHDDALVVAQAAQSHIGLARALINDPTAAALRKHTLEALIAIRGVGDAVIAAQAFTDADYMFATENENDTTLKSTSASVKASSKSKSKSAREAAEIEAAEAMRREKMEALGLDPNGKIPASLRAQINSAADEEKRRKTRAQHDMIDRELMYLASFFRDVLILQTDASLALINPDFRTAIVKFAETAKATQILQIFDAINEARARLKANVTPQLLLEAVLIEIYLSTQNT